MIKTFQISRVSNYGGGKNLNRDRKTLVSPVEGAYIKSDPTDSYGELFYWAIDLDITKLIEFQKQVDEELILGPSSYEDMNIEIYDTYRE